MNYPNLWFYMTLQSLFFWSVAGVVIYLSVRRFFDTLDRILVAKQEAAIAKEPLPAPSRSDEIESPLDEVLGEVDEDVLGDNAVDDSSEKATNSHGIPQELVPLTLGGQGSSSASVLTKGWDDL
jgi:hypothetical protein